MRPALKLLCAILFVAVAVLLPLEYAPLLLLGLCGVALWANVPMAGFALACVGLVLFIAVFNLAAFGGWERAMLNSAHAVSIMMPFYLFSKTCTPHEMMEGMREMRLPEDFSFVFCTALPFSKVVGKRVEAVRIAQQSRGSRSIWSFTVPVFHSIFQKAAALAASIESRGGIGKKN